MSNVKKKINKPSKVEIIYRATYPEGLVEGDGELYVEEFVFAKGTSFSVKEMREVYELPEPNEKGFKLESGNETWEFEIKDENGDRYSVRSKQVLSDHPAKRGGRKFPPVKAGDRNNNP